MKPTYSNAVLELNPELAVKVKKSKAKTPSGRGHGFTDDAQHYPHRSIDPRAMLATQTAQYLSLLAWWTARGCEPPERLVVAVRASCAALREWCEANKENR